MAAPALGSAPSSPASPSRRDDGREQKILDAVADKRLFGKEEEVYYLLRGLGMPTVPGELTLRIEVSATRSPSIFAALRRLGFRSEGGRIRVEPRPAAEAAQGGSASPLPAGPGQLHGGPPEEVPFVPSRLARSLGRPHAGGGAGPAAVRRQSSSPRDPDAAFARMQRPRQAQSKATMFAALVNAANEEWPRSSKPARELDAPEASSALANLAASKTQICFHQADAMPASWSMARSDNIRSLEEQQCLNNRLSRPVIRRSRSAAVGFAPSSKPSTFGMSAQRNLCERLEAIHSMGGFPWKVRAMTVPGLYTTYAGELSAE